MKPAQRFPAPARVKLDPETGMNRTETEYANLLEVRRLAGEIQRWRFEPIKFRLGHSCYYTPDFEIVNLDGALEYVEVKGFWRDDARVKIKAVAAMFSDRKFTAVQKRAKKNGGGWMVEEMGV